MAAVIVAAGLTTPSSSAAVEPADFCAEQVVHDYLRPLKELQESSALPPIVYFGPRNLRASTLAPLLVGGGWVGYSLYVKRGVGAGVVHLGWRAKTELSRINRFGDEVESIRVWRRQIGVLSDRNATGVRFKLGDEPGLYRLLAVVRNKRGRTLGGFGYYIRVVRPITDARLALNASAFSPGQTVLGHVENLGTTQASFGAGLTIERLDGSAWSVAPESPTGPVPAIAYIVPAGMSANRCSSFTIPASMPPGHYRMTLSPELTTEFDVG